MSYADDMAEAEAITRRIEQQVRDAQAKAEAVKAWAADIERITGEGQALRGAVRVAVNHSGVVTSLKLTDSALDAGASALATAIMQAMGAAKQAVADEMARSVSGQFGRDSEVAQLMINDLDKRMQVRPDPDGTPSSGAPGTAPYRPGPGGGVIG